MDVHRLLFSWGERLLLWGQGTWKREDCEEESEVNIVEETEDAIKRKGNDQ